MESLMQMDELSALVAPDMSTDTPDWCENCQVLRQNIKKLEQEQEQSFVKLKQKIISTDLLIKKYKSKCEDYDIQFKKNEESTKRADKFQRQSEILETQLKATLMETEPLRAAKSSMEVQIKQKDSEIIELGNKLVVAEGAQRQYEHLTKSTTADIERLEAEKRDLKAQIKVLEGGKITKDTARELKGEISMLKKENTGLKKNEKRLERKLKSALSKIEELTEKLKECRTMPAERRRKAGSFLSPLRSPRSPCKSPRVRKVSPSSSPKKTPQRNSPKQPIKAIAMNMKQSESETSNDDDDDNDIESVYKFSFSPVMPCLSPLPLSPACFNQVQRRSSNLCDQLSDEENLSDMADELEHQLFGDFMDDDSKDGKDENTNKSKDTEDVNSDTVNVKDSAKVEYASTANDVTENVDRDRKDETMLNHKPYSNDTHTVLEFDKHKLIGAQDSSCATDSIVKEIDKTLKENTDVLEGITEHEIVTENVTDTVEKTKDMRSVKERLASSLEILSPTANRKPHPCSRDHIKDKPKSKSEFSSPERSQTSVDNSVKVDQGSKEQSVQALETLSRNDTTEFEPSISEHEGQDKFKKHLVNSEYKIPVESDNSVKGKDSVSINSVDGTKSGTSEPMSSNKQVTKDNKLGDLVGEINVDIIEETVPVKLPKKLPPSHGYLTRQRRIKSQSDSQSDSDQSKDRTTRNEKYKMDSSFAESEDEIGFLQNTHTYTVLEREAPQRASADPKKLKNIKKRLRSRIKFKDHDSASLVDNHKEQKHITSSFINHDLIDAHDKEKVCDKSGPSESKDYIDTKKKHISPCEEVKDIPCIEQNEEQKEDIKVEEISETSNKLKSIENIGAINDNGSEKSPVKAMHASSGNSLNSKDLIENPSCSIEGVNSKSEFEIEKMDSCCVVGQNVNHIEVSVNISTEIQESTKGSDSLGVNDNKQSTNPISPSRQLSTGFVVHSSMERTASTESPTPNVEIINSVCDSENVRSRSPFTRQRNILCETISEEAEPDIRDKEQNKLNESSDMILGIDDLFADQEESESRDNVDLTGEMCIFGSKLGARENTTSVNEHESLIDQDKNQDKISSDNSRDFNIDNETINVDMKQRSMNNSSESFSININEPGCSYHHENFQSSGQQSSIDGENIAVTSTSCATTSFRFLTKTPEMIDNEQLTLCQSRSRSTTPSICSIDMAMPPLSPLSISPFDFITPISPLPPSPVRQVDRVSPLSPETVDEIDETEDTGENEHSVTNENEKNVGNIPEVLTPERSVMEKVLSDSPVHVPNLISPIKTPKQVQSKKMKEEKGSRKKNKTEKHQNQPIKFVSSVPTGILTVKPKQETSSLQSNLSSKTGSSALGKQPGKGISLRKHVVLKKSIDLSNNLDSVFVRKSRHTTSQSKTNLKEKLPMSLKINFVKETGDNLSQENQLVENGAVKKDPNDVNRDTTSTVDETGDDSRKGKLGLNVENIINIVEKDGSDQQKIKNNDNSEIIAESDNKTISDKVPIIDLKNTNTEGNVNSDSKSVSKKDSLSKEPEKVLKVGCIKKDLDSNRNNNEANKRKAVLSDADRKMKFVKQSLIQTNTKFSKTEHLNKLGSTKDKQVTNTVHTDVYTDHTDQTSSVQPASSVNDEANKPNKPEADELPAGYDPLMASKRKTRMAHQPRSHPALVKKPPVIIEPLFQTQTTRRKRKSQDSTDKEPTPKKQVKQLRGPLFQKQRVDMNSDPLRQELTRKLESFLKSNEKLETFCRNVAIVSDSNSVNNLIHICIECIGRYRGDCLDSVYQSCESDSHLNLDEDFPLLNNVEKKAVLFLSYVTKHNKELDTQNIIKLLWDGIFTKEMTISMTGKMSLARLFTAVCLQEGDIEQVRVLLYHVAMCGYLNHWLFVVPIVSVWPEVLCKPVKIEHNQGRPVLVVYEYLVTKSLLEQETESSRKVLKILKKLCNWSGQSEHPEIVLRQLTNSLFDIHTDENSDTNNIFEVVQACKLLLKNEAWSWCNEYFINRQGLQPAYNRYMCKKGTVSSAYVCAVLDITGFTIACHSEYIKQRELSQICKTWLLSMMSKEEGDPIVQNCCLETLLEISAFNPNIITDIHVWLTKNPSHSLDQNLHKLEILRQTFKEKFGLNCEPYVR